jgi:hypothetical protein
MNLSGAPAETDALFPELLAAPAPAPPVRPRGSRVLRALARVILWSLILVGALRGLLPTPAAGPGPGAAAGSADDARAQAVAAAFMREYLTVGGDQAGRAARLAQFTAAGLDLRRSVSLPAGVAQYADHLTSSGSRPVEGGVEVTVLAHVLQLRSGVYQDGGTLAFAVPLAVRREGVAVSGRPRPTALPSASGLPPGRPRDVPAELSPAASRMARRAVIALVARDTATLTALGANRAPPSRQLPAGWRATSVGDAHVTASPDGLTAEVPVRARPPTGPASYVVPVRVHLEARPEGLTIRRIDAGGSG